jgi:hypothetical protein
MVMALSTLVTYFSSLVLSELCVSNINMTDKIKRPSVDTEGLFCFLFAKSQTSLFLPLLNELAIKRYTTTNQGAVFIQMLQCAETRY